MAGWGGLAVAGEFDVFLGLPAAAARALGPAVQAAQFLGAGVAGLERLQGGVGVGGREVVEPVGAVADMPVAGAGRIDGAGFAYGL